MIARTPAERPTARRRARRSPRSWSPRRRRPAPRTSGRTRTASPSTSTEQAPQTPCSQPRCVPVSPRRWRRKSASVRRGGDGRPPAHAVDGDLDADVAAVQASSASSSARVKARATTTAPTGDAIVGRSVEVGRDGRQIGDREAAQLGGIDVGRAGAGRHRLGRRRPFGGRPEPEQADRTAAHGVRRVELDGDAGAGDGEVAVAAGDLLDGEAAAPVPARGTSRRSAPRRVRARCPRCPVKNSAAAIVRRPAGPCASSVGVECERHGGELGGRVGVGDRAADRAAVADLEVSDVG